MTNTTKKESAAPVIAAVESEIMPVIAAQAVDYEQTAVKPPRIQQIEQYIEKRKDKLEQLPGRITAIEEQRPTLAFGNKTDLLLSLEKTLNERKMEYQVIQNQILGAEAELKREVKKWIDSAKEKRMQEKQELENEFNSIKKKVKEHLDAISKIEGTPAILSPSGYRSDKIKEQLKFGRYNDFKDIDRSIYKIMGWN